VNALKGISEESDEPKEVSSHKIIHRYTIDDLILYALSGNSNFNFSIEFHLFIVELIDFSGSFNTRTKTFEFFV
jgi:hypothetical protein